jgi:DnaJ-class molecular chaperone
MFLIFILIFGVVVAIGYFRSLRTHPFTKCRACDGRGRFNHKVFPNAIGLCSKCGGNGRELRRGAHPPDRK